MTIRTKAKSMLYQRLTRFEGTFSDLNHFLFSRDLKKQDFLKHIKSIKMFVELKGNADWTDAEMRKLIEL